MSEPTINLAFLDLYTEVADYLGWGRTPTTARVAEAKRYVNNGYRRFLYPIDPRTSKAYHWSFLAPEATIIAWPTTGGSMTVTDSTTVTDTSNTPFHASMIGHTIVADDSENEYTITAYTSTSVVTIGTTGTTDTGEAFTITADGTYSLPDDFGGLIDGPAFDSTGGLSDIRERTVAWMRDRIAGGGTQTGEMDSFAIQPMTFATATGQRYEILVGPIPTADKTLYYRYRINPAKLSADTDYPYGGPAHAETILELSLAAAEERLQDGQDFHQVRAQRLLAASIDLDASFKGRNLGYCGDYSDDTGPIWDRRINDVTY